jgi:hypothetical protein
LVSVPVRAGLAYVFNTACFLARGWVQAGPTTPEDLDALALADEKAWQRERRAFLLY